MTRAGRNGDRSAREKVSLRELSGPTPASQPTSGPPHAPQERFGSVAAASVMAECLRVHADVAPRSAFARFFGLSPLSEDSRPWYRGALGELDVAARLAMLGDGWTVVHSVPVGTRGSDIDHVVVGAAGVFTINSKNHEGARVWVASRRLLVNGQKTDHLRNSRYEAARTHKLLSDAIGADVPVRSVIAIVGAKDITTREQPDDVAVLSASQLVRWLKRQKPALDPAQVAAVAAAVCTRATWSDDPDTHQDLSGFAALRREVNAARHVQMAWGAAVLIAVLGITMPLPFPYYERLLGG